MSMHVNDSENQTTVFAVHGMSCQGCVRRVSETIGGVAGVATAAVDLEAASATVRWEHGSAPAPDEVVKAVEAAGFRVEVQSELMPSARPSGWSPLSGWQFNVFIGGGVTMLLLIGEWGLGWGLNGAFRWASLFMVLPVQLVGGARFYRGAWNQLKVRQANMDLLVALGSTTAFAYSVWALLNGGSDHLYFMESAAIITLISLGHWMEARASGQAALALRGLLRLAPAMAREIDSAGVESEVPVAKLKIGDRVLLKPGDRIPTDGVVAEGASVVDESILTGKSMPVEKAVGDQVYAGTSNQNGRLIVTTEATGDSTALAHIIAIVQRAQNSRAKIQKLGDQVSAVFVPIVVLVAVASGLWWGLSFQTATRLSMTLSPYLWHPMLPSTALAAAMIQAAAVLIVACPCAMGLATPAAIMAGANTAARRGILVRDALALEKSGLITAVVFDKTGTLTQGKVAVVSFQEFGANEASAVPLQRIVAALAEPSDHPLSRAMATWARTMPSQASRGLIAQQWEELRGCGVVARTPFMAPSSARADNSLDHRTASTEWRLGALSWLKECAVNLGPSQALAQEHSSQGASILGLAENKQLRAVFALQDGLKPRAPEVVATLLRQGKAVYLITGDHQDTAAAVARQSGIPSANVFAEIRPERKAAILEELQQGGHRVAFVGDGINDAPALEQADLGIAVSKASDIAREAADIILLRSDIEAIPDALEIAQATLRTIKQNLFWAFFYNAAAVPLAALGFMSPVLCAAAMGVSDLLVIGNALRLTRWHGREH